MGGGTADREGGGVGFGGGEFGFGAGERDVVGGALADAGLDELQRVAADGGGLRDDTEFAVEGAEREVRGGDFGGEREARGGKRGTSGVEVGAGALVEAADAAEEVELPREIEREAVGGRRGIGERVGGVARAAFADEGRIGGERRQVGRAGDAGEGAGLFDAGERGAQVLVGGERARLECIERGVVEGAPPVGREGDGGGVGGITVGGRGGCVGALVIGADGRQRGDGCSCGGEGEQERFHGRAFQALAGSVCAVSTTAGAGFFTPIFSRTT